MDASKATRLPLSRYQLFRATDINQARHGISRLIYEHDLDFAGNGRTLDVRLHAVRLRHLTISYITYGATVRVVPGVLHGWFASLIPVTGRSLVRYGMQEFITERGSAAICSPVKPLETTWSADCAQVLLCIEYKTMERVLTDCLGRPPEQTLEFAPEMQLRRGPLQAWRDTAAVLIDDLDRGVDPSWELDLEQFLIRRLLLAQPNNFSAQLHAAARSGSSELVQRVMDLMESDLHRPWTVDLLAHQVGVSAWTLQAAFRRDRQTSPMRCLMHARMSKARRDLLKGDPMHGDTVAKIAFDCGFNHLSRFSGSYRARYGELPSQTLRS